MEIITLPLTPFMTNCYVLKDGGEALIVDPGEGAQELKDAVAGSKVTMIFNTHCHVDHCGGNADMVAHTGAPLVCHEKELTLLRAIDQQGAMFGVSFPPSPEPDQLIEEGDEITVGSETLQVLLAPGHSPGHVVLAGDGFVIAGDVLFAGSIGRTDLWGGNHQQLIDAIKTKLLPLPDETIVYSGHGPPTTIGRERASNPFLAGS